MSQILYQVFLMWVLALGGIVSLPLKAQIEVLTPEPANMTLLKNSICKCNHGKIKSYRIKVILNPSKKREM
jgi:hypothetical protein